MLAHPGGEQHSRYLIELAFLEAPCKWLDMGAGDGATVRLLHSLGYEAEGIDLVPRGENVIPGDYLQAPYGPGSFDGIIFPYLQILYIAAAILSLRFRLDHFSALQ